MSFLIFFIHCYDSLVSISPYFCLVVSSRVALCYDLIPLFIHIGISCINYGPLIVPEIRIRSSPSSSVPWFSTVCFLSGGVGICAYSRLVRCVTIFEINRCLCCAATLSRASSISPESNPFHRSHKVLLTFKIHSSGFIHWSEVARAPKTNKRSKEWDQWWPDAQDTSRWPHAVAYTAGDNTRREVDLLLATLSVLNSLSKEDITQINVVANIH